MQKSITSFFGAPKGGTSKAPSPKKPAKPATTSSKPKKPPATAPSKEVSAALPAAKGSEPTKEADSPAPSSSPKRLNKRLHNGSGGDPSEAESSPEARPSPKRKKVKQAEDKAVENDAMEDDLGAVDGGRSSSGEEAEKQGKSRKLRRISKKAIVEDSDDEVFGGGEGMDQEAARDASPAASKGSVSRRKAAADTKSSNGASRSSRKASKDDAEQGTKNPVNSGRGDKKDGGGRDEPGAAAKDANEDDGDDDDDDDGDGEGDDEGEEEVEDSKTVSSALMAGAKKSASSSVGKKTAKGTKTVAVVMEKTKDLVAKASWKKGQPVPFQAVADVFYRVEQTTKRLEIQEIVRGFFCTVISLTPEDLVVCVYLACNELAPAYERLELGIGDAVLQKAIQGATGRSARDVKAAAQKTGDLGEVAQHSTKAQGTLAFGQTIKSLSARQILESYRGIARVKGSLSQDDKINRIKKLLVSCKGLQAKYIIRGLQGKMRIGLSVPTVMVSLSHAGVTCPSEAVLAAEKAEGALRERVAKEQPAPTEKQDEKSSGGTKDEPDGGVRKDKDACQEGGGGAGAGREANGGAAQSGGTDKAGAEDAGDNDSDLLPVAKDLRGAKDQEVKLELATQLVKQAYSECPNLDLLIGALLSTPLYRLQQLCRLRPGVPVSPMLAKPTKSIGEVLSRLSGQEFTCEFKYDGVRAQVHLLEDGTLRFFSRNSKDSSSELPDLIPVMKDCAHEGLSSYVIDTEVVAYDRETGNLLPFQMLSTRGRKEVDAEEVKVKVIVEAFDIIYLNGKSLLQEPLIERRKALRDSFKEVEGRFRFATYMDHKEDGDTGPIEEFLSEAVKGNCEGLMIKTLTVDATYEPSKRSLNWLKLKKDYLQADGGGVGDSLDLVPIGAFLGRGKRAGKYGAYLLGCYDPDREEYQSVCKIGTGFTDEVLLAFWTELKEHTVETRPRYYNVADTLEPDVWLAPHKVWEVKCADLSKSPVHKAAIGKLDPDRGISIRFPRLLRERNDKDPEQATTADQILDMYQSQDVIKNNVVGSRSAAAEDDWEL